MSTIAIPNRPFATETITGLMLPDGIFEATLGNQRLNAVFENTSGATIADAEIYVEGVSDPGIAVTSSTYTVTLASSGKTQLVWDIDLTNATPGDHLVSFVMQSGGTVERVLKKIFVTRVGYDAPTNSFTIDVPEGRLSVTVDQYVRPTLDCCGCKGDANPKQELTRELFGRIFNELAINVPELQHGFVFCPDAYLPLKFSSTIVPTTPYAGQYGEIPFQDPWWKILLCILAVLLLIAAAVAEAVGGSGNINVTAGDGDDSSQSCCGVSASGDGTNAVAAALVAAAAACATAAALSDARDPYRRGQDATPVAAGEITTSEDLAVQLSYPEPVALGRPFQVGADWKYVRHTNTGQHTASASDMTGSVHVLSRYVIDAPDLVYLHQARGEWTVRGQFYDSNDALMTGDELFVQCILVGPNGQYVNVPMNDFGEAPDVTADDGWYTGRYYFAAAKEDATGLWSMYVIAQDINTAQPNMTPEQAAQIIGGMVVTHQLTIDFTGRNCKLVPDGKIRVL